jgi:hypothetical protein
MFNFAGPELFVITKMKVSGNFRSNSPEKRLRNPVCQKVIGNFRSNSHEKKVKKPSESIGIALNFCKKKLKPFFVLLDFLQQNFRLDFSSLWLKPML